MKDDIDNRIERVLKSVASKKTDLNQWESDRIAKENLRKTTRKSWRSYGISIAASIIVICGIGLGIFRNRGERESDDGASSTSVYRGGSCDVFEIKAMIDSAQYDKALQAINITLADTVIDSTFTPERQNYLRSLNANREYELLWLKIEILVKTKKTEEAVDLLKKYVNSDGVHQKEAKELLHKLIQ